MPIPFTDFETSEEFTAIPLHNIQVLLPNDFREYLAEEQITDPKLANILNMLNIPRCKRKSIRRFTLKDGLLLYTCPRTGSNLPVIPAHWVSTIVARFHDDVNMGHMGVTRTLERVRQSVFFFHSHKLVERFVRQCPTCQFRRANNAKPIGHLQSLPVGDLFDRVSMDVIGPLPITKRRNRYIVVAVEFVSRYVFAVAIKQNTTKAMLDFLMSEIIHRHGVFKTLLTDNASTFRSSFFQRFNRLLGSINLFSSPYHSRTNGLVERQNRSIEEILSNYVNNSQKDWDKYLGSTIYCLNTAVHHDSTGYSSYYLLHGRHPYHPLDVALDTHKNSLDLPTRILRMQESRKLAKLGIERAQARQALRFNKTRQSFEFSIGDVVLIKIPTFPKGTTRKLSMKYRGPYKVIAKLSPLAYHCRLLSAPDSTKPTRVHIERMRLYLPEQDRTTAPGNVFAPGVAIRQVVGESEVEIEVEEESTPENSDNSDSVVSESNSDDPDSSFNSSEDEEITISNKKDKEQIVTTRLGRTIVKPVRYHS